MYETRISVAVEEDTAAFTKMLDKGTNNVKKGAVDKMLSHFITAPFDYNEARKCPPPR